MKKDDVILLKFKLNQMDEIHSALPWTEWNDEIVEYAFVVEPIVIN